jgi:hypothetical protein
MGNPPRSALGAVGVTEQITRLATDTLTTCNDLQRSATIATDAQRAGLTNATPITRVSRTSELSPCCIENSEATLRASLSTISCPPMPSAISSPAFDNFSPNRRSRRPGRGENRSSAEVDRPTRLPNPHLIEQAAPLRGELVVAHSVGDELDGDRIHEPHVRSLVDDWYRIGIACPLPWARGSVPSLTNGDLGGAPPAGRRRGVQPPSPRAHDPR